MESCSAAVKVDGILDYTGNSPSKAFNRILYIGELSSIQQKQKLVFVASTVIKNLKDSLRRKQCRSVVNMLNILFV